MNKFIISAIAVLSGSIVGSAVVAYKSYQYEKLHCDKNLSEYAKQRIINDAKDTFKDIALCATHVAITYWIICHIYKI